MTDEPVALETQRIVVERDRMLFFVRVCNPLAKQTTPQLAECVLKRFPSLKNHACDNGGAPTFLSVIGNTMLPHLLEHLIIDLQVRYSPEDCAATFVGTTEWINEEDGLALVQVSYIDDLIAMRAFGDALQYLNGKVVL